jgi:2Fe-2S ferredoxin
VPRITIIQFDGAEQSIDASTGKSLMQNVMDNGIPGIDADCGGECACGTCHCFVDDSWLDRTGQASELEDAMLGMRPDRAPNSRLACQISIDDSLDGMVVRLPEFQM